MNKEEIIDQTVVFVQTKLVDAEGGHDWWHIYRVWQLTKTIAHKEQVDLFTVELGALLHDIADSKFHDGDETIGPALALEFLESKGVEPAVIEHVLNIIKYISFKGGNEAQSFESPELAVVQDADRLDAIGAIGIARAFNYGGFKNRALHDPTITPQLNMSKETYKKNNGPTINHFYEKLLLLKDRMNTETGRSLALQRHAYLESFLEEFMDEWEGNK
jgi:uncharacterized protein